VSTLIKRAFPRATKGGEPGSQYSLTCGYGLQALGPNDIDHLIDLGKSGRPVESSYLLEHQQARLGSRCRKRRPFENEFSVLKTICHMSNLTVIYLIYLTTILI